jgi:16S rRNA (guanine966-N2)-methyltransferase
MQIVAGKYKGRTLHAPKGLQTRPTASRLRESLFNICQHAIGDVHFLDLFAGSGAIGFEALSRGARCCTFVDSSRESLRCIAKNAQALDIEGLCELLGGDVFAVLGRLERQGAHFEVIFADPPYGSHSPYGRENRSLAPRLLEQLDSSSLLVAGGLFFLEEAADVPLETGALHSLRLHSSRRCGPAQLYQFVKQ